jgi:hypothetical protein
LKKPSSGNGTMCPSYKATEWKIPAQELMHCMREFLTHSEQDNKFDHKNYMKFFDLLACKL